MAGVVIPSELSWVADSSATDHMTSMKQYFFTYKKFSMVWYVNVGNSEQLPAHGKGVTKCHSDNQEGWNVKIPKLH